MNYIGLTIGPIFETLTYSKKTRELWVGSYFFSFFMKELISKLYEDEKDFLIPYVSESILNKDNTLVGIYHDRFILKSNNLTKNKLKNLITEVLNELSEFIPKQRKFKPEILNESSDSEKVTLVSKTEVFNALLKCFQYKILIISEEELEEIGESNYIKSIDNLLDNLELNYTIDFMNASTIFETEKKEKVNPINRLQYCPWSFKRIVGKKNYTFKSIPEIAIAERFNEFRGLLEENKIDLEEDNLDKYESFFKLIEKENDFCPYHKYYVVVSADGDKIGNKISTLYNKNDLSKIKLFSKSLFEYISGNDKNTESLFDIFDKFGGTLIYAGGDDLLGFLPVYGKDSDFFLTLLEQVSKRFKSIVGEDVSLSFGVSINYYKYPMIEAISNSYDNLEKAKSNNTETKSGSICFGVRKNSNKGFSSIFYLNDELYNLYKKILSGALKNDDLSHSLNILLNRYKHLIIETLKRNSEIVSIDNIFKNLLEDDSRIEKQNNSLENIKNYLVKSLEDCNVDKEKEERFENFLNELKLIKFLRGDN